MQAKNEMLFFELHKSPILLKKNSASVPSTTELSFVPGVILYSNNSL